MTEPRQPCDRVTAAQWLLRASVVVVIAIFAWGLA